MSRQQTGQGVWIDCNLFDSQVHFRHSLAGARPNPFSSLPSAPTTGGRACEHCVELPHCRPGGHPVRHSSPIHRTIPSIPMQRRLPNDWCCERSTGVSHRVRLLVSNTSLFASQFRILSAEILELPSMATDPKFSSPSDRVANRVELCGRIERRLKEESRDVWMVKFKGKGYLASPSMHYS